MPKDFLSLADATTNTAPGITQLQNLIQRLINLSVDLAFVALLFVFLISGIRFITSGGDPKAVGAARQGMTVAVMGIAFFALAWIILKLIETFTGVQVTQFCLGFYPYCAN